MSKVLEKIVFKRLYEYLTENRLLTEKNSGFKKKDSTTNQLLKIVHQIYQDLNDGKDTCMVILDVSKAFGTKGYSLNYEKWVYTTIF